MMPSGVMRAMAHEGAPEGDRALWPAGSGIRGERVTAEGDGKGEGHGDDA